MILRSGFNDSDSDGAMVLDGTIRAASAGQYITLDLNQQQSAVQGSTGALLATHLRLLSNAADTASFSLGTSLLNDIDVFAANTSGSISFRDLDDLTIGFVAASSGIAAMNGIQSFNGAAEGASVSVITSATLTATHPAAHDAHVRSWKSEQRNCGAGVSQRHH
ncbi:MAG UNVERIFIED_CONTAM: hypothetical protein LVR18_45745 [Planctomycetaceae bacterium]